MPNIAYIFPGQGAQQAGMGKELYDSSPEAKAIFDSADKSIPNLSGVIFNGPQEKLTQTSFCQPGIFTYSVAALEALKAHPKFSNLEPKFACGLSLGEYGAICATGALNFEETLRLVERRSFFMEEATKMKKGAMAAVLGMDRDQLVAFASNNQFEVANFNSPDQIVITGEAPNIEKACVLIKDQGAKRVIPLDVSGAFHSSLMEPAAKQFEEFLNNINISTPTFPILSNVDAIPENNPEKIKKNLTKQITSSVQWVETIENIAKEGVTHFLEIGPGTVLKGLIRKINRDLVVRNIQTPDDIDKLDI